jgi:hypothetical protein
MPNNPNEQGREDRRAEDDPESGFRQIAARRHSRELAGKKFEIAFDQGEVGPRLIGLPQREDVFVWHITPCGRTRLPRGKAVDKAPVPGSRGPRPVGPAATDTVMAWQAR